MRQRSPAPWSYPPLRQPRCGSFSRAGGTAAGAPIIRSSPCRLSGTGIHLADARLIRRSITIRSIRGAAPHAEVRRFLAERFQHAAEAT